MDFTAILAFLVGAYPVVKGLLAVLGLVVVVAKSIVKLTPSLSDDEVLAKLFAIPFVGAILQAVSLYSPLPEKKE